MNRWDLKTYQKPNKQWATIIDQSCPPSSLVSPKRVVGCIWAQNHTIAYNMITSSPIAAKYLDVSSSDDGFCQGCGPDRQPNLVAARSQNVVFLKDSQAFSDICNSTRTSVISKLASENNDRPNCVSKSNTSSKLGRLAKLWITFGKSLISLIF